MLGPRAVGAAGGLARPLAWGSDVALNVASGAPGDKSLKGGGDGGEGAARLRLAAGQVAIDVLRLVSNDGDLIFA